MKKEMQKMADKFINSLEQSRSMSESRIYLEIKKK